MSVPDGPYTGVVDRFEEDRAGEELAVVLLERDGREVDDVAIPRERLPRRGRRQNAVLRVVVQDGDVTRVWYDARATRDRGASAQTRLDRIAKRAPKREDRNRANDRERDEE